MFKAGRDAIEIIESAASTSKLDLSGRELCAEMPKVLQVAKDDSIGDLIQLRTFIADSNYIDVAPVSIGNLSFLSHLSLVNNSIRTLPESISALNKLETLLLDRNKLTSIPHTLFNLSCLTTLSLSENSLVTLIASDKKKEKTPSFASFSKLKRLNLSRNKLFSIPCDLANATTLQELDLSGNDRTLKKDLNQLQLDVPLSGAALETVFEFVRTLPMESFTVLTVPADKNIRHRGYLSKQGGRKAGGSTAQLTWKRRYFVIDGSVFRYFKNDKDSVPLGEMNLRESNTTGVSLSTGRAFTFSIAYGSAGQFMMLQAESKDEYLVWVTLLRMAGQYDGKRPPHAELEDMPREQKSHVIDHSGFLTKIAMSKSQKKRFFTLRESQILIFKDDKAKQALGEIHLTKDTRVETPAPDVSDPLSFALVKNDELVLIAIAGSETILAEWLKVFRRSIQMAKRANFAAAAASEKPTRQRSRTESMGDAVSGYLQKFGKGKWKRRWAVLSVKDSILTLFINETVTDRPIGRIALDNVSVSLCDASVDKMNAFSITSPDETPAFCAAAEDDKALAKWLMAIKACIRQPEPEKKIRSSTFSIGAHKKNEHEAPTVIDDTSLPSAKNKQPISIDVVHAGWMHKQGGSVIKNWKKRWHVIHGTKLKYYKSPTDPFELGELELEGSKLVIPADGETGKPFSLGIAVGGKTFYAYAQTRQDLDEWQAALTKIQAPLPEAGSIIHFDQGGEVVRDSAETITRIMDLQARLRATTTVSESKLKKQAALNARLRTKVKELEERVAVQDKLIIEQEKSEEEKAKREEAERAKNAVIESLRTEVASLSMEVEGQVAETEKLKARNVGSEGECAVLRLRVDELTSSLGMAEQHCELLQCELSTLGQIKEEMESQSASEKAAWSESKTQLSKQIEALTADLEQCKAEFDADMRAQKAKFESDLTASIEQEVAILTEEKAVVEAELDIAQEQITVLDDQVSELNDKVAAARADADASMNTMKEQMEKAKSSWSQSAEGLEARLCELEAGKPVLESRIETLQRKLENAQGSLHSEKGAKEKAQAQLRDMQSKADKVAKHVVTLEEQAVSTAHEMESLKLSLDESALEMDILKADIAQQKLEFDEMAETKNKAADMENSLTVEVQALTQKLASTEESLSASQEEAREAKQASAEHERCLATFESQAVSLEQTEAELREKRNALATANARLQTVSDELKSSIESCAEKEKKQSDEIKSLRDDRNFIEAEASELRESISIFEEETKKLEETIATLKSSLMEMTHARDEAADSFADLQKQLTEAQAEAARAAKDSARSIDDLKTSVEALQEQSDAEKSKTTQLMQDVEMAQNKCKEVEEKYTASTSQLSALQAKLSRTEEMLESERAGRQEALEGDQKMIQELMDTIAASDALSAERDAMLDDMTAEIAKVKKQEKQHGQKLADVTEQLKAKTTELENAASLHVTELSTATAEVEAAKNMLEQVKAEHAASEAKSTELEGRLRKAISNSVDSAKDRQETMDALQEEVDVLRTSLASTTTERDSFKAAISIAEEKADAADVQLREVRGDCGDLRAAVAAAAAQKEAILSDLSSLRQELDEKKKKLDSIVAAQADLQAKIESAADDRQSLVEFHEQELSKKDAALSELQASIDALKSKSVDQQSEIDTLASALESSKERLEAEQSNAADLDKLNTTVSELQFKIEQSNERETELSQAKDSAATQVTELKRELDEANADKVSLSAEIDAIAAERDAVRSTCDSLRKTVDGLEGDGKQELQDALTAMETEKKKAEELEQQLHFIMKESDGKINGLEDKISNMQAAIDQLTDESAVTSDSLQSKIIELEDQTTALQQQKTVLSDAKRQYEADIASIRAEAADDMDKLRVTAEEEKAKMVEQHRLEMEDSRQELMNKITGLEEQMTRRSTSILKRSVHFPINSKDMVQYETVYSEKSSESDSEEEDEDAWLARLKSEHEAKLAASPVDEEEGEDSELDEDEIAYRNHMSNLADDDSDSELDEDEIAYRNSH